MPLATSAAKELLGFIHDRMFDRTGVGIESTCLEAESPPPISPAGNRRETFGEDFLRLCHHEAKARRCGQRASDSGLLLIFGDSSLVDADTVNFQHWVDVVCW